jgi:hypothetical protein
MKASWKDEAAERRKALALNLGQVATRRARLTDALIDGLIDRELFEERQAALLAEKRTLEERLANLKDSGMTGAERLGDFLERLDSAYTLYESGTTLEKRELLAEFTSNWRATGKEIDFTVRPEVLLVANRSKSVYGAPQRNSHRTASARRLDGRRVRGHGIARRWDALFVALMKELDRSTLAGPETKFPAG